LAPSSCSDREGESTLITSLTNARIKEARRLQRRRDRHELGQLLLEGVRLVRDAVDAGVRPVVVFYVPEAMVSSASGTALLEQLTALRVDLQPCSEPVFASLAETQTPQGIAAVVPLPRSEAPPAPSFTLILDRVRDPGNAGTLLRAAEAAGVELVIFGPDTVDPFNDKVVRAAMGAHFRLPLFTASDWTAVQTRLGLGQRLYLAEAEAPLDYDGVDWTAPAALVVGGEADGAGPAARAQATPIAIPMVGGVESLNAGVAGAVILFEAARQRRQRAAPAGGLARG
jgi:RNA methyltransferase, TrmH family